MGRPPRCPICNHDQAANINAGINGGQSQRSIAKLWQLNIRTIKKHVNDRHAGVTTLAAGKPTEEPTESVEATPEPTPEGRLKGLILRLEADMQAQSGPVRPELARELRMAYTELAKISHATPDAVKITDVEGLPELLKDLFLALEPFPEARTAMADVLRTRMALAELKKQENEDGQA